MKLFFRCSNCPSFFFIFFVFTSKAFFSTAEIVQSFFSRRSHDWRKSFLKLETFYTKKILWSKTLHQCLSCSWNSFGDVDAVFNSTHAWVLQGLWFWRHEIKITSEPRSVCRILCFFLLKARNISNKENALVENVLHENATSMLVLHWIAFGDVGTVFKSTHAWVLQEFWFWEHEIMIISQPRSICSMLI